MAAQPTPLTRQNFAKLLAAPGIFTAAFLPIEHAEWRGERYTLGRASRKLPKGVFVGARLQVSDPRNIDRSRERAVQHDLSSVVKSVAALRTRPELAGAVLSSEMAMGRDPAGVNRVRFGLSNPASGAFRNEAAAAAECHARITRAIRASGLALASAPGFDPATGFSGLQAWAESIRLRPSRTAAALWWTRTVAAAAAVGLVLWLTPPVARGIQSLCAAGWSACVAMYEGIFPSLEKVTGVLATDGDFTDRVTVTWDAVPKATGYALYRDDMSVPFATVAGGSVTTFDDQTIEVGRKADYAVRATTMFTHGDLSREDDGFRTIAPPTAVRATSGTSTDAIDVAWDPVENAETYVVLRSAGGGSEQQVATSAVTPWRDTSAPVGVECRYRVCSRKGAATSEPSEPAAIGFRSAASPTGLTASDGTNTAGIDVIWNTVDGATVYRLARSSAEAPNQPATQVETRSSSYLDRSAEPGRTYVYRVVAVTAMGSETAPSGSDDGWRGFVQPRAQASRGMFSDRVHLDWTEVPGAEGYEILRDDGPQPVGSVTGGDVTSFDDRSASADKRHSYVVRPLTKSQRAPASEAVPGWRAIPPPPRLAASRGFTDRVVIEWEPVNGASRYEVSRDGTKIATVAAGTANRYEDHKADIGIMYEYTIASESESTGPGPASAAANGYRNLEKPGDVQVRVEGGSPVVIWKPVTGATGYEILRSDNDKGPQGFSKAAPWKDDQPAAGPVTYRVRGRTATVTGPESEPATLGDPE